MPIIRVRRRARRPQLECRTPLVALAAAQGVIEEASQHLDRVLPARYAAGLAHRARRTYAHSASFREKMNRPGDAGRDLLWMFMRHWLADRLQVELPLLYRRLPRGYAVGAPTAMSIASAGDADEPLSPYARLIAMV